jgi:hypothetical protein
VRDALRPPDEEVAIRVRTAAALIGAIVAADIALHLVGVAVGHGGGMLDADSDSGIFGWVGSAALAAGAAAALVLARRRPVLLALAAALLFVLVASRVHLRDHVGAWPLVYVPVLGAIALLLVAATRAHDGARRLALAALVLLAVSLGVHELGPPLLSRLGWGPGDWAYEVKIALKGSLEAGGWLLAAAALGYAAATTVRASSSSRPGLRRSGVRPALRRSSSLPNSLGEPMKRTLPIDSR